MKSKTRVLAEYLGKLELYPTGHRVLIKPYTLTEGLKKQKTGYVTAGGIEIPMQVADEITRAQHSNQKGLLVAVGFNAFTDFAEGQPWCEPGQEVHFARHAGARLWVGDEEYVIMDDSDIIAVSSTTPPGWTAEEVSTVLALRGE